MLTLVTDEDMDSQWIQVKSSSFGEEEPSQYLKWVINDDAKIVTNENLVEDQPYMTPEQIKAVSVHTISINPKDESATIDTVELSGSYKNTVTPIALVNRDDENDDRSSCFCNIV